jgi:FkbM family methyltransferase
MLGRAANFVVLPMAVAEKDGCSEFYINRYDAASSLLPMNEESRSSWIGGDALLLEKTITVPTIRLDTFMTTAGIARVDFLKIDTQGNDLAVIRSAGQRIQNIRRITLEVDVTPNRLYEGSPSKEEVVSFLRSVGFRLVSNEQQSYQQEENLTFERSTP